MKQPENAIVVAVGHQGCDATVRFAAAEARRTHSPVHLVQVVRMPGSVEYADIYATSLKDFDAELEQALAATRKASADADIAVTGELAEDGGVVHQLVEAADRGRMIVLQHRRTAALHRLVTGSTINGVAARAAVPVVSVPDDWSASPDHSLVTVAVQDADEAAWLLRVGFEQARSRQTSLLVLHAWWLASGYDVPVVDDTMRSGYDARTREAIAPALSTLRAEFPDVEVAVQVRHAPPAEAILDAAAQSALLVLGRRHHLLPLGSHLGPIARTTLHHSACPVLMAPPAPTTHHHRTTPAEAALDATSPVGS
jgi:nucleotide-binding universal stress UspA family protein